MGSIEQRLAEMISPVKTVAEVRAEQQLNGIKNIFDYKCSNFMKIGKIARVL